jgi:hypothetical protein
MKEDEKQKIFPNKFGCFEEKKIIFVFFLVIKR